jgi:hypothetical protein
MQDPRLAALFTEKRYVPPVEARPAVPTEPIGPTEPAGRPADALLEQVLEAPEEGFFSRLLGLLEPLQKPSLFATGLVTSELKAKTEVLEEKGLPQWMAGPLATLTPPGLGGIVSDDVRQRQREILGVEGEDFGLRGFWNSTIAYQQERPSAFWGEKFIAEVVIDPLNLLFLGAKPISALAKASHIARAPVRAEQLAVKVAEIKPVLDLPTEAHLLDDFGTGSGKIDKILHSAVERGAEKIPFARKATEVLNPSALLDKARQGDQLAIHTTLRERLLEFGDNLITTTMAPLRATAKDAFRAIIKKKEGAFLKVEVAPTPAAAAVVKPTVFNRMPSVEDATKGNVRLFHGSQNVIEAFDLGQAQGTSLYGPGIYLTADPKIASGYALTRVSSPFARLPVPDHINRAFRERFGDITLPVMETRVVGGERFIQISSGGWRKRAEEIGLESAEDKGRSLYRFPGSSVEAAPNIQPVTVNLNKIFDIDAPADKELLGKLQKEWAGYIDNPPSWDDKISEEAFNLLEGKVSNPTNKQLYRMISQFSDPDHPKVVANDLLLSFGYDGITHIGGGITGSPAHRVVIALGDDIGSVEKVINPAISRLPGELPIPAVAAVTGRIFKEVSLGDVFQNRSLYILNDAQKAVIKLTDEIIDAGKTMAEAEGVRVPIVTGEFAGEHYFPRWVEEITGIATRTPPMGGSRIGIQPSVFKSRLKETMDESVQNGVKYVGGKMDDPISDMVETYLRSMLKASADARLVKSVKSLGKTVDELVAMDSKVLHRRNALKKWVGSGKLAEKNISDAFYNKHIAGASIAQVGRFSKELGDALRGAMRLPDSEEKFTILNKLKDKVADINGGLELELLDAKDAVKVARETIKREPGYRALPHPGFSGKLFPVEDVEKAINLLSDKPAGLILKTAEQLSDALRLGSLTLDFGFAALQGAMVATRAPTAWIKASRWSLDAFFRPQVLKTYLSNELTREVGTVYKGMVQIGSPEMLAGMGRGGIARRIAPPTTLRGTLLEQTFGRFTGSFELWFDVARMEMAKAFIPMVKAGKVRASDVAGYVNKMTGVTSSRALGVPAHQRSIEASVAFLAPRWTRATVALALDAIQSGFRGAEARKSLALFFGGTVAAYSAMAMAMGQPIRLNPRKPADGGDGGKFMTLEIGGTHMGLGGKPFSMARTLIKMAADPDESLEHLWRFYRGSAAPVTSTAVDILSGKDFMGEPLRTPDNEWDWKAIAEHEGGRFLPFYIQSLMEDPPPTRTGFAAEFFGGRSWPVQAKELRDDLQDELAAKIPIEDLHPDQRRHMEQEGMGVPEWDILTSNQKNLLRRQSEQLRTYSDKAKKQQQQGGKPWLNRFYNDIDDNRTEWEVGGAKIQERVDKGQLSPREFKKQMGRINTQYAAFAQRIYDPQGDNARALQESEELRQEKMDRGDFKALADEAKDIYIQRIVAATDLEITSLEQGTPGEYDYEEANLRREELVQAYGERIITEVEQSFQTSKDAPRLWRFWIEDRDKLKDYWNARDRMMSMASPAVQSLWFRYITVSKRPGSPEAESLRRHPALVRFNKALRQDRQAFRRANPELEALLLFWGYLNLSANTTSEARRLLKELVAGRLV